MNTPILRINDLQCHFGGLRALDGASFDISPRKVTGLIGPNGAGKTTLFNCVSGLLPKTAGTVVFKGEDISDEPADRISSRGLVRTFQLARGCPRMTVFEHLMLYGNKQSGERVLAGIFRSKKVRDEEADLRDHALVIAKRLKLDHVLDNLVTNLSGGQKKLLEIGRALMADPEMILLDEPMAGVNPALVEQIASHLEDIRGRGVTVLLIEHDMSLIEKLCDEVIVMAEGKFLTRGRFREVAGNRTVQEAYLGMKRS